jgi:hypothetical protein
MIVVYFLRFLIALFDFFFFQNICIQFTFPKIRRKNDYTVFKKKSITASNINKYHFRLQTVKVASKTAEMAETHTEMHTIE